MPVRLHASPKLVASSHVASSTGCTQFVKHFSELASEDEYRRGIGFKRLADTLQNTLKVLEKPVMDQLLQPGPLKKARDTAKTLLPHCAVLNAGTHNLRENPSNKRRKVQGDDKPRPTYEAIHDACTALMSWLKDPITHKKITEPNFYYFRIIFGNSRSTITEPNSLWNYMVSLRSVSRGLPNPLPNCFWELCSVICVEELPNRNRFGTNSVIFLCVMVDFPSPVMSYDQPGRFLPFTDVLMSRGNKRAVS